MMDLLLEDAEQSGRITAAEYRGYSKLLQAESGLFLVDVGNGEYDTYLSREDISALVEKGVSEERTVKVHPSQLSGENTVVTLYELQRFYETIEVEDSEGNALPTSAPLRLGMLRELLRQEPPNEWAHGGAASHEGTHAESTHSEESPEHEKEEKKYFLTEKEKILDLIDEDEASGALTHAQAEQKREMAERGELILVDMGSGEFDTYLSLEDAEALMKDPANKDRTLRLYNSALLEHDESDVDATGEVKISELEDVFARKDALGPSFLELNTDQAQAPDVEDASPVTRSSEQGQKTEKGDIPDLPPPAAGIPESLLRRPKNEIDSPHSTSSGKGPRKVSGTGEIPLPEETLLLSTEQVQNNRPIPQELKPISRMVEHSSIGESRQPVAPVHSMGGMSQEKGEQQEKTQRNPYDASGQKRKGSNRYNPSAAQPSRRRPKKRWRAIAAATGVGGSIVGGPVGFTILRRMKDPLDLTAWIPDLLHHFIAFVA